MKLKEVSSIVVNISKFSNWVFVVLTTESGLKGFGECTLDGFEFEVMTAVKNLGQRLIGKHVLDDHFALDVKSGGMITAAACSGLDMAAWDLKGKALGLPVYKLLGGAKRKNIPVYCSFNRAIHSRRPEDFAQMARKLFDAGNIRMKCAPFDDVSWRTPYGQRQLIETGKQRFIAMREELGPEIDLAIDIHWRMDTSTALRVCDDLLPYNPFWFETPLPEHKPELIRRIRELSKVRIAGSEMQPGTDGVLPLIEHQCLDVYMPDIRYVGGITGLIKMNALLESYDLLVSPHNMSGPISTAASLHVAATMNNLISVEYHVDESEWEPLIADHHFDVEEGCFKVPEKPGLGVNLNLAEMSKHPYQKAVPLRKNMLGG